MSMVSSGWILAASEKEHSVKCPTWRVIFSCAAVCDSLASHGTRAAMARRRIFSPYPSVYG